MGDGVATGSADRTFVLHDLGGRGSPLLICHATGFCGQAYLPLAELLAPHHHVFAIDFRGHGDAPTPEDGDFAWLRMTAEVEAAAEAIDSRCTWLAIRWEAQPRSPTCITSATTSCKVGEHQQQGRQEPEDPGLG